MDRKLDEALWNDDYEWNKEHPDGEVEEDD